MKLAIALSALLLAGSAHAADNSRPETDTMHIAKLLKVSKACAAKIMKAAVIKCNKDSKASEGDDRMHGCLFSPALTTVKKGVLNIVFTVGDADEWGYNVQVTDESDKND